MLGTGAVGRPATGAGAINCDTGSMEGGGGPAISVKSTPIAAAAAGFSGSGGGCDGTAPPGKGMKAYGAGAEEDVRGRIELAGANVDEFNAEEDEDGAGPDAIGSQGGSFAVAAAASTGDAPCMNI